MLVAYRTKSRAVFLYGFAKNERENIEPDELLTFRDIAADLLAADSARIAEAIENGVLQEIDLDEEKDT
jgi:hypothetical protein